MRVKVIRIMLDKYICTDINNTYTAIKSGNMKKSKICVGDDVDINISSDMYVISKVFERKNSVIRPPVCNIDQMILCISISNPSPDYILLDKQIILCLEKNITPVICITKIDLDKNSYHLTYIKEKYNKFKVIDISTKEDINIKSLKEILYEKTSAFSGNSGVGKSSLINLLLSKSSIKDINTEDLEIGDIARKTKRGKHTTKEVNLFALESNTYILDTPGFSSYELFDINYKELKDYYPEFNKFVCNYLDCNHINESVKECKVKEALQNGDIDEGRYERYKYIFNELKEKDSFKYKK